MRKVLKHKGIFLTMLLVMMLVVSLGSIDVMASGTTYQLGGEGWSMRLDSPGTDSKPYYHVHFYKRKSQKYCLRLDTLKPCDGYTRNPVPKSIMKKAKNKLGRKWGYGISKSTINWGRSLAIAGAALAVIVATICPFDGVAGDAVAWGLLLGVV